MLSDLDSAPDWEPWEDEDTHHYLIRVLSQAVWQAGAAVDRFGAELRDQLWRLADRMLNAAYPPEPVEVDLIPGVDASKIVGEFPWGMHGSPEDPT